MSGFTLDDQGRRVDDGWDHDGDLIASFQGDLNRQRDAGDRLMAVLGEVAARVPYGDPVWQRIADARDAWMVQR